MANYLDPASSSGSSEMKTVLQLTNHLLQHRYKEAMIANGAMSPHMKLESFKEAGIFCTKYADAGEEHPYNWI